MRDRELSENASKLAENPEFLKVYKENGSLFPVAWARRAKAEAYLTQKNGTKPTAEEIKELSENKVFKMIVDKNPSNYAQKWDENDKKAEELGEKYKKELENMTYGLADYDSGLLGYVFNDYDPDSSPNPKFEEKMKKLKAIKKANKAEKNRIFEARENLEDIEDPGLRDRRLKNSLTRMQMHLRSLLRTSRMPEMQLLKSICYLSMLPRLHSYRLPRILEPRITSVA